MNPKKYFITFSDQNFLKQSRRAIFMAKKFGKFDFAKSFSKFDIDDQFYQKNKKILDQKRGAGYWLWKPYFIQKVLAELNFGDFLFYSDSGAIFLKNINNLIIELEKNNQDIMGFELPLIEEQWTKKELLINLDCENDDKISKTNQILASYILIKKTEFSFHFFNQLLELSKNEINITDITSNSIKQSEYFIEHRHDQSIFSILYKKNNLRSFIDPSQYGNSPNLYVGQKDLQLFDNNIHMVGNYFFRINRFDARYSNVLFHYRKSNLFKSLVAFFIKYFIKPK
jgi:hypothetical protein